MIMFMPGAVHARDAGLDFGVELGMTLAHAVINSDHPIESQREARVGVVAGAVVWIHTGERLSVQTGALYQEKGGGITIDHPDGWYEEVSLELDYVTIPVLLRADVLGEGSTVLYASGGAEIDVLVSATYRSVLRGSEPGIVSIEDDFRSQVDPIDLAVRASLGLEFPLGARSGFVEVRYALGLTNVWKGDTGGSEFRNRVGAFIAGLRF
jgi:hypothetical protein